MTAARRHRAFGATTGWWATAARLLALVLALSLVAPAVGLADDMAYHDGGRNRVTELSSAHVAPEANATDPGMACHLHCGCHCHQAAPAVTGFAEPVLKAVRPAYGRLSEAVSSVTPDRQPRPPRA
jgi:hypothetical protein